jgi:hypothetical protein
VNMAPRVKVSVRAAMEISALTCHARNFGACRIGIHIDIEASMRRLNAVREAVGDPPDCVSADADAEHTGPAHVL